MFIVAGFWNIYESWHISFLRLFAWRIQNGIFENCKDGFSNLLENPHWVLAGMTELGGFVELSLMRD